MELIAALYRCASDVAGGDERSPHWKRHDEQRAREGRRLAVQSDGEKNENLQILGRCDEADDVFKIPYQNSSKTPHYFLGCHDAMFASPVCNRRQKSPKSHAEHLHDAAKGQSRCGLDANVPPLISTNQN